MMPNGKKNIVKAWAGKPDADLVQAAQHGDKVAFVEVVARFQTMVCGIAFGILNDFSASEDAAQETFLTAWRKLKDLRDPAHLRAWLAQIARNAALSHLRRRNPTEQLSDDFDQTDESPTPDDAAASEDEHLLVQKALARLPEQYRTPLVLFYCEGHSSRGVADALGVSDDVIRQRLSRGRELLRTEMEGMIESVLVRNRPSAIFTMTVAAGIGALAMPTTVAAAAFTASSSPLNSFLTAMGASKPLTASAVAILVVSMPVGYHFTGGFSKPVASEPPAALDKKGNSYNPTPHFEESAIIAEWLALLRKHGRTAQSMPAIYAEIQGLKDPLRQTAFTMGLIVEWTVLDPEAAAAFFTDKPYSEREQFFREWFKADPKRALASLPDSERWHQIIRENLKEVARVMPEMLTMVVNRLPEKQNFYDSSVRDAFGAFAERDLKSARLAAEKIAPANQIDAFAGIAQAWAQSDLEGAITWAKGMEGMKDELVRAALIGVARVDPVAALERMNSVPPGGREAHGNSTTGARILEAAARADFATTVNWLKEHPSAISREDADGLSAAVTERLLGDPKGFLTEHANTGSLGVLLEPVQGALMNRAEGKLKAVWEWLQDQPENENISALRSSVLDTAGWHHPDFALELVKALPPTPKAEAEVKELARTLLNGGHYLERFDRLYSTAPERLRGPLLEQAFENLSPDYMESPQLWLGRVSLLPEEKRATGAAAVARAWARQSPEEAAEWVMAEPPGETRTAAMAKIAAAWAVRDEAAARAWVEVLSPEERRSAEEGIKAEKKR